MGTSDLIALAALMVAAAGLGLSVWALVYSRRSAAASRDSADEAKRLREIEAERRAEERERRHEELGPVLPGQIEAEFRENRRLGGGHGSLFGAITLPRGYRVKAEARIGRSRTELSLGMVVAPGREVEFQIEPWHPEQEKPRTDEIVFRFWPPVEGADDVSAWACGCGRPSGEAMDGPGHWEQRVKVSYYRIEDSVH
jgi:hypothetical protein